MVRTREICPKWCRLQFGADRGENSDYSGEVNVRSQPYSLAPPAQGNAVPSCFQKQWSRSTVRAHRKRSEAACRTEVKIWMPRLSHLHICHLILSGTLYSISLSQRRTKRRTSGSHQRHSFQQSHLYLRTVTPLKTKATPMPPPSYFFRPTHPPILSLHRVTKTP